MKIIPVLNKMNSENIIPKGNDCRTMGDCIIVLESLDLDEQKVTSTNVKDFLPLCTHFGVELVEIDD